MALFFFFRTGMMMVSLRQVGTTDWSKERLKVSVKTSVGWSAHYLRAHKGMPSGPGTLCRFTFLRVLHTSILESSRWFVPRSLSITMPEEGVLSSKYMKVFRKFIWERSWQFPLPTVFTFVVCDGVFSDNSTCFWCWSHCIVTPPCPCIVFLLL